MEEIAHVDQLTITPITLEEYRKIPETMLPIEVINGYLIRYPVPYDSHQRVLGGLLVVVAEIVKRVGGQVLLGPLDTYLGENVLQPDLLYISGIESRCQHGDDGFLHGAPDLVAEVVHGERERYDRGVKFNIYEQYSVREYWLVDPEAIYVEVYILKGGKLTRLGAFGPGETFTSTVLKSEIGVGDIFKQP
jgi:Uma2 family endonuclease